MKKFIFVMMTLASSLSYGSEAHTGGAGAGPLAATSADKFAWYSTKKIEDTLELKPYSEEFTRLFASNHRDFPLEGALYVRLLGSGISSSGYMIDRVVVAKPDATAKELSEFLDEKGFFVRLIGSKGEFNQKEVQALNKKLTDVARTPLDQEKPQEVFLSVVPRFPSLPEGADKEKVSAENNAKMDALDRGDKDMIDALKAMLPKDKIR